MRKSADATQIKGKNCEKIIVSNCAELAKRNVEQISEM